MGVADILVFEAGPLALNSASPSSFFLRFPFAVDAALEVAPEAGFEVPAGDPIAARPRRFVTGAGADSGGSFVVS